MKNEQIEEKKMKNEKRCENKNCQGWFIDFDHDSNGPSINRCDNCKMFIDDKAAAKHVQVLAESMERLINKEQNLTLENIWNAIENGKTVCWSSERYEVHPVESNGSQYAKPTEKNGLALRCSCMDNYFGSLLAKSEFSKCFIVDKKPTFGTLNDDLER